MENDEDSRDWESLIEPDYYPDPGLFKLNFDDMTKEDQRMKVNMGKSIIHVLAPYLKIVTRKHKRGGNIKANCCQSVGKRYKLPCETKSIETISKILPSLMGKHNMIQTILQTGDILKSLTKSNSVVFYYVSHLTKELVIGSHEDSIKVTLNIETSNTIAAFSASSGRHVASRNIHSDPRFPEGLGFPVRDSKFALCVPITTPDHKVVGVFEITRDALASAFNQRDIQIVLSVTGWIGVAILQNTLHETFARVNELTDCLTQLTCHYNSDGVNEDSTLSNIVVFARDTVGAERCCIFIVYNESSECYTVEEYDQGYGIKCQTLYKRRTKKRVEKDSSVLSKVLFHRQSVNIYDDKGMEGMLKTTSLLCVPVYCSGRVIGAIQLMNKILSDKFDNNDEDTLKIFASFVSINFNNLLAHRQVKKCEMRNGITKDILLYHIKPCTHGQEGFSRINSGNLPKDFFTFPWYPTLDDIPKLVDLTVYMFRDVLAEAFLILNNVPTFVLTVQKCYRPNPYHNFLHAFCVTHSMANIIRRYSGIFTGVERCSLMIAALCHDLDHRGYNNNFLQLTNHYLASLYDSSELENHHFAVTKMLIQQCGLFKHLRTDHLQEILAEIYRLIIATDLTLYFPCRMEFLKIADEKSFTFKNTAHRRLVKSMMMTVCDLSGQTKPLPVSKEITDTVYEEFFNQGDVEKKLGFVPFPTMDRDTKYSIAENQIQFLSVVVIPCVESISRILSYLSPMVWDARRLLEQWKDLAQDSEPECLSPLTDDSSTIDNQ